MVQMEIISRVFRIVFGTSTGTAFTIEDHGVQFLVTAKHMRTIVCPLQKSGDCFMWR